MNAAKVTLTSTILAAALGLALGLMAAPGNSYACHKDGALHGNQTDCDNGGDGIVYEATLTGAFVFDSVVVTPNTRENVLRSNTDLLFDIIESPESVTWFEMFNTCEELWDPGPVVAFFVGEDDWSIDKAGGVRVVFRHIASNGAEWRFQLIGNQFDFDDPNTDNQHPFPPAPPDTSVFVLDEFAITAKSLAGGPGGTKFCRLLGDGVPNILLESSILEITAMAP